MKGLSPVLKQTLLYGSSIVLMKGISLLMLPFITHHLPQAEFGQLEIISSIAALGSVVVGLGLEDAMYRFIGADYDKEKRKRNSARIFTLTLLIGVVVIPSGWVLAEWLDAYVPGGLSTYQLRLVLLMLALEGCIAVPLGWLRMQNRAYTFFSMAVGRAFFHAGLTVAMLFMDRGIDGILEASVIAAITQAIILTALQAKDTGFGFSASLTKQSLIYSLPIMASGLMAFSLNGLDRWVLAEVSSLKSVAQFGVAAKFALVVVLLLQPFSMWWMPKRFDILYSVDGRAHAMRFTCYGLIVVMIIAVVVAILAPIAIRFLLPESYMLAAQFTALLIAAALFKEMSELLNLGSFAGETSYAQLAINTISAVIALSTLWWWGNMYGVYGILLALAFTQGLRMILFFFISQSLYYLPYPKFALILTTSLCLVWLTISQYELSITQCFIFLITAPLTLILLAQKLNLIPRTNYFKLKELAA
ncbi:lipopolysaccharide biosynthesis protein [Candidatus Enterovibrio altilux]|uniref:Oligosaccharide translocase SypK n=1 Tax=Candidatus Enterovibrio altilux TaxID=1927128 RepID=A0A291B7S5_9GAMM|nr:lipopolysaccharide biosynthesis protein [Candidatus Enterovibrio luxaltus]ATF09041.1 Oligosaccharide translocase SypK [Candidatus Enterovibrio luxaltus]